MASIDDLMKLGDPDEIRAKLREGERDRKRLDFLIECVPSLIIVGVRPPNPERRDAGGNNVQWLRKIGRDGIDKAMEHHYR